MEERKVQAAGTLREMRDTDTEAVLRILNESILTGQSTARTVCPTKEEWEDSLLPTGRYVCEENGELLGFVVLHPYSGRSCYSGVAEISVYVAARAQRRGIGGLLLQTLLEDAPKHGFWSLTSNIFATNSASCQLHEALGFRRVGYRERVVKTKSGEWMSIVIYELRLPDADE